MSNVTIEFNENVLVATIDGAVVEGGMPIHFQSGGTQADWVPPKTVVKGKLKHSRGISVEDFRLDPSAIVDDLDRRILPEHKASLRRKARVVDRHVSGTYRYLAELGDGVAGVRTEVREDLVELTGVDPNQP